LSGSRAIDYRVEGRVGFHNLVQIREAGEAAIAAAADGVVIDLSALDNGNSAAVALLMAWYRAAEIQNKSIVFVAAPEELANIVELSGLTDVLPLEGFHTVPESVAYPAEAGQ
jgi:phospholipid transport system transporter-binding protein